MLSLSHSAKIGVRIKKLAEKEKEWPITNITKKQNVASRAYSKAKRVDFIRVNKVLNRPSSFPRD
jgi:hypothetical protein